MSEIAELFKTKDYCFKQIREARGLFGSRETTEEQYDAMERVLALGFLYCPRDIAILFESTLYEAGLRRSFYITNIWA